jgi:hypothetical protein
MKSTGVKNGIVGAAPVYAADKRTLRTQRQMANRSRPMAMLVRPKNRIWPSLI